MVRRPGSSQIAHGTLEPSIVYNCSKFMDEVSRTTDVGSIGLHE